MANMRQTITPQDGRNSPRNGREKAESEDFNNKSININLYL
jgi:hypothetical protein